MPRFLCNQNNGTFYSAHVALWHLILHLQAAFVPRAADNVSYVIEYATDSTPQSCYTARAGCTRSARAWAAYAASTAFAGLRQEYCAACACCDAGAVVVWGAGRWRVVHFCAQQCGGGQVAAVVAFVFRAFAAAGFCGAAHQVAAG